MNACTMLELGQADCGEDMLPDTALALPVFDSRSAATADQWVLEETPVALVYNGITHAVMLATPQDLEDFALGFSLSEDIVRQGREVFDIDVATRADGVEVAMRITGSALDRLKQARQMRTGRTGCGLCGVESLAQFSTPSPVLGHRTRVTAAALHRAMASLPDHQHLHRLTGAAHAAGWADADGKLLLVREDIGRHNALDKLIGAMVRSGLSPAQGFCVLTSRASYEMVQKAARTGIGLLAAVSAPSALAVRVAQQAGLTLAGFVRHGQHAVYSHAERVQ
ncbi:formate dehydrogenase accessory sulfurtransferase FdhD [Massilia sp. CCM 8733]|uniref:Sulfur carrier protein FdhD n=1 Tax=Massilia mucilaginosa TaxID=2609282 RepID=A0ABX0NM17_9BURK|nr:formate dehydrogenase accessory sulfurtransferase FdhD [Massilia mucilaginosa]NHZ87785.1 formate dehydrogenase accessory sulfurtransferase FdhD [Massilia mucilaginosa]